ncbi:MAG: hypothetical protein CMM15_11025 [Rhodospirillaceae bacterium]|nr:hypothetical protein [Rhodospirillaceae bacterium]|tara:strand:- start:7176 stop:7388 length:213 start_codon:yes stop_codon:yes gene_type:complete
MELKTVAKMQPFYDLFQLFCFLVLTIFWNGFQLQAIPILAMKSKISMVNKYEGDHKITTRPGKMIILGIA